MHQELNLTIDRDCEFTGNDVVAGFHIIGRIESKKVLIAFVNLVRMNRAELSIRAGIPEIERKLAGLRLNLHRVRLRRREVHIGPRLLSEYPERQNFRANENEGGDDHQFRPARNVADLRTRFALGELPDEEGKEQYGPVEWKTRFSHSVRQLFVYGVTVSRDILRLHVLMSHDGIRGNQRDDRQNHSEQFPHSASHPPG